MVSTPKSVNAGEDVFVKFRPLACRCDPPEVVRARLLAESVALEGVRDWMRKLGFTSYEQTRIRGQDPAPDVSSIAWDLSGPSYIRPMARPAGGKLRPGFVVADIILRLQVDAPTVAAAVRSERLMATNTNRRSTRRRRTDFRPGCESSPEHRLGQA